VKTSQFIKTTNRYNSLNKVRGDNEVTIPVIVNGDISTEGGIKVTNRNASHKEDSENGETKPKKKKIIIIGDNHARDFISFHFAKSQTTLAKNLGLVEQ
jgi:predicted AAA+ superfamily ATPase